MGALLALEWNVEHNYWIINIFVFIWKPLAKGSTQAMKFSSSMWSDVIWNTWEIRRKAYPIFLTKDVSDPIIQVWRKMDSVMVVFFLLNRKGICLLYNLEGYLTWMFGLHPKPNSFSSTPLTSLTLYGFGMQEYYNRNIQTLCPFLLNTNCIQKSAGVNM